MYQSRAHVGIRRTMACAPWGGTHDHPGRSPAGICQFPGDGSSRTWAIEGPPPEFGGRNSKSSNPGRRHPPCHRIIVAVDQGFNRFRSHRSIRVTVLNNLGKSSFPQRKLHRCEPGACINRV
jgi:hypothetical protein